MLTEDLGQLLRLEGCLAGEAASPSGQSAALPACTEIAELTPSGSSTGPRRSSTRRRPGQPVPQRAVAGALAQAPARPRPPRARRRASRASPRRRRSRRRRRRRPAGRRRLPEQPAPARDPSSGRPGCPRLDDPQFVSQVVFDTRPAAATPKARFAYLFPSPDVGADLGPAASPASQTRRSAASAIDLIREAAADEQLRAQRAASYVVSGVPVVVEGLADASAAEIVAPARRR